MNFSLRMEDREIMRKKFIDVPGGRSHKSVRKRGNASKKGDNVNKRYVKSREEKMEFCICDFCGAEQEQHSTDNFVCDFCGEENSEYIDVDYYPEFASDYYELND